MDELSNNVVETEVTNEAEETITMTKSEWEAQLQSNGDKRVSQAEKKWNAKHQKELSLAKLDGSEREKALQANRIAELEQQLAEFTIERNKSELKSVLSARGLSAEFADIITITDDIEASQANIDALDKLFKAAVKAEVEKRLAGSVPKGNGTSSNGTPTKADIMKMSLAEQQKFKNANPQLYKAIFNNN